MKENPNYGIGRPITDYVKELEQNIVALEKKVSILELIIYKLIHACGLTKKETNIIEELK